MNVEKVSNYIENWLIDYAKEAQVNTFIIGVSGGIDSATTATLCAKTGLKTICLEMPIHQDTSQVSRAKELVKQLEDTYKNVSSMHLDLTETFECFKHVVPTESHSEKVALTLANTRARIRMTTLYYVAGLHGGLVVGTGNKVEDFGVGFYTKYGDGGVDLSPIADLLKSEVFELGRFLNVPKSIQEAQPTDGLFGDSRTDEDQIGASYDELEWAMKMYESGKKVSNFTGRNSEVFKIYTKLHKANQHKMKPIPVCIIPKNLQ